MSTPSETMFTAHDPRLARVAEGGQLPRSARLGVQHDHWRPPGRFGEQAWRSAAHGYRRRPPRARPRHDGPRRAARAASRRPRAGSGAARRAIRSRSRAVAAARLTGTQDRLEGGLDHILAAAPRERAVERHERHRAADSVGHRLGVGVGDVGDCQGARRRSARPGSVWRPSEMGCPTAKAAVARPRRLAENRCPRPGPRRDGAPRRGSRACRVQPFCAQLRGSLATRA